MSYILQWTNPATVGKSNIVVPVASQVDDASSLTFTGKGAANYGQIQQTNFLHLLENFAGPNEPDYPTIGQTWYDTLQRTLKLCVNVSAAGAQWSPIGGLRVTNMGEPSPSNPNLGDLWFERGPNSGFLHLYTGSGRFPEVAWDADAAGVYPPSAPAAAPYLHIKINFSDFTTPNSAEAYISGYVGSTPSDTNGQIKINGALTTIPRGSLRARFEVSGAYIVWDPSPALTSSSTPPGNDFFVVRSAGLGRWEYDDNTTWRAFTPSSSQYVIGTISISPDDASSGQAAGDEGITAADIWEDAIPLMTFRIPKVAAPSAGLGGWQQVWPTVEYHGSRFEYDELLSKVLPFIGTPATWGGNDSARVLGLTDLESSDANLLSINFGAGAVADPNLGTQEAYSRIKVEPVSRDWDTLLAAARWAISRLDVPATLTNSISRSPFTVDGRTPPAELTSLSNSNIRYPSQDRLANRRFGSVTAVSRYIETLNALEAAVAARYTLSGIAGTGSTLPNFSPSVTTTSHCTHGIQYNGGAATTLTLRLGFKTQQEIARFIFGGSAVDFKLLYVPGGVPSAQETAMSNFVSAFNRIRVNADKVYVFGPSAPLTLATMPVNTGLSNLSSSATTTIASFSQGSVIVSIRGRFLPADTTTNYIELSCVVQAPGPLAGALMVEHLVTRDAQTLGSPAVSLFPAPNTFTLTADIQGSSPGWLNGTVSPTPVPLAILSQPASATVTTGGTASFSVSAQGTAPITYQWQRSIDNGVTFSPIAGANTSTYTFTTAISNSGQIFRVVVTDTQGSLTSATATLTVVPAALAIDQNVTDEAAIAGTPVTFQVRASGPNPITYQWQTSTSTSGPWTAAGPNAQDYSFVTAQNQSGSYVRCIVSDGSLTITSAVGQLLVATANQTVIGYPVVWGPGSSDDGGGVPTNITTATWKFANGVPISAQQGQPTPPQMVAYRMNRAYSGAQVLSSIVLPSVQVSIAAGSLPPGMSITQVDATRWNWAGQPTGLGNYPFTLVISSVGTWGDSYTQTVSGTISVVPGDGGVYIQEGLFEPYEPYAEYEPPAYDTTLTDAIIGSA